METAVRSVQRQNNPKDPMRLFSMTYFISVFGSGILLARNWKQLGKPEWVGKTTLMAILIPLISIAIAIGSIQLFFELDLAPMIFVMAFLAFGVNMGFVWALARLQNGAYKKWQSEGDAALESYMFDIDGALIFGGLITLGGLVVGLVMAFVNRS
jgi:hypothetical protein